MNQGLLIIGVAAALLVIFALRRTLIVVPQQSAWVVERLGQVQPHAVGRLPHPRAVHRAHPPTSTRLKERAIDIPEQICITQRQRAGRRRRHALPARCSTRRARPTASRTTSSRSRSSRRRRCAARSARSISTGPSRSATNINSQVVSELDKASEAWGVKVLRYEIKNITPPHDVLAAMEKQMRAEREKRAVILTSEGERDAAINSAEGDKQQVIKAVRGAASSSRSTRREGQAAAILAVATATAEGIRRVAEAIKRDGRLRGGAAPRRRALHPAVRQARAEEQHAVVPANLSDIAGMIALATKVFEHSRANVPPAAPRPRPRADARSTSTR